MTDFALEDAAGGQYLDSNSDGVNDIIAMPNADGTSTFFIDRDQDGIFEGAAILRSDGTAAATFHDQDGDGRFEGASVDQNANGIMDTFVVDTNSDGQLDTTVTDFNENGVTDNQEVNPAAQGPSVVGGSTPPFELDGSPTDNGRAVVGPATNRDPVSQLIIDMAAETGMVAYGPVDDDHDGVSNNNDSRPHDPYRT